ncbi:MAG TPA: flavodoxin family protein [Candidatus Avoscillospira avistercoris]|uniref:Flavodoxin family protein n=1 Tax=Candidatus Avoscillospira avistercoris TaxID=2840707 RepID=A0A9D1F9D6_9FIRM|nr:flavodoxin family protein [Candidatus Avoscillospira avistercoris]
MSYAIVYSSRTGNTKALADAIREVLPPEDCCYFGPPDAAALAAQRLYIGFWTDKGTCDGDTAAFLAQLSNQEVFLFGTAGFGGSAEYFEQIAHRVETLLPAGVTVLGHHLCQGRMPMTVRQRYAAMEDSPRRTQMLENFDAALSHPDAEDLRQLQNAVR